MPKPFEFNYRDRTGEKISAKKAEELYDDFEYRVVARTVINSYPSGLVQVITIWDPFDAALGLGTETLFETSVVPIISREATSQRRGWIPLREFGQPRCFTEHEAKEQHTKVVKAVMAKTRLPTEEVEYERFETVGDGMITSARSSVSGGHEYLSVWVHGQLSGVLILSIGDAQLIAGIMGLIRKQPSE